MLNTQEHLKRLRIRLTLVYAIVMAAALLFLSGYVIRSYVDVQTREAEAHLLESAQQAASVVYFNEEGDLIVDGYYDEDLQYAYPQLWVLEESSNSEGFDIVAAPSESYFQEANLEDHAYDIIYEGDIWTRSHWGDYEGREIAWSRGITLIDTEGNPQRAAIVAVADPDDRLSGYDTFRTQVYLFSAGLVLLSALAGYVIAGRGIRPAARALEQQERLIADAAHELRTPIARIRAVAEGGIAGDEPPSVALERVVAVTRTAGGLVDDLLVLARMDAGGEPLREEPFRLDLLAEAVVDQWDDVGVEAVETVVNGDPALIRRAITNLVDNAVRHGRQNDPEVPIRVTVYPNQVTVTDCGPGIDPAVADSAFDRFQTGSDSSGHGLGLAITQWIASAHGGSVTVGPNDPTGTVATLYLPGA